MSVHFRRFGTAAMCLALVACGNVTHPTVNFHQRLDGSGALVPAVTDQTPLDLPTTFGSGFLFGVLADLNQSGDYLFASRGQSGVFLRPAGAAAPTRLLQSGDEVPGFPGSRIDIIRSNMRLNDAGLAVIPVAFGLSSGQAQGAILAFDGCHFTTVAFGGDIAPGTGGALYGAALLATGINAAGTIAFVAPVEVPGVFSNHSTVYLAQVGSTPVRIAGFGDPAPGTAGTFGTITGIALNDHGEVLFQAAITGGAGGLGLFVGSVDGVRKVVAQGDPNPLGGTFTISSVFNQPPSPFNNAGQTVFTANGGIFLHRPETGITVVAGQGTPAPAPVGGSFSFIPTSPAPALDDAGEILFAGVVTGSPITNSGLFRYRPGSAMEVVAYANQVAPGTFGQRFSGFTVLSINGSGQAGFRASIAGLPIQNGVYRQSGSDTPTPVALDLDPAPVPEGGSFQLGFADSLRIFDDGSLYFSGDLSGAAVHGEFLATSAGIRVLLHSGEPLPDDARVVFRTFKVGAAGDYLAFLAHRTGGRPSLMVHNLATGLTSRVFADGDVLPGTGGTRYRLLSPNKVHVNSTGRVAFMAVAGNGVGLFLWTPEDGTRKLVIPGDVDPASGRVFANIFTNEITPTPINSAGQVLFRATLAGALPNPVGLFIASAGGPPQAVVLTGDPAPGGGTFFDLFQASPSINEAGQVAFLATTLLGSTRADGIFLGVAGSPARKVVATGDPGPQGSTFLRFPRAVSLNDNGEVAFLATLTGGPEGGVFVGTSTAPPESIALNGEVSPGGGVYSGLAARPDALVNNGGDVAFRADLTGGPANSGYFFRRGREGSVQSVVLEGQPAPGTSGRFGTIPPTTIGILLENMILRQNGELAFAAAVTDNQLTRIGYWRFRTDGSVEKILARGDIAPASGGGVATTTFLGASDPNGRIVVDVGIAGGTLSEALYVVQ